MTLAQKLWLGVAIWAALTLIVMVFMREAARTAREADEWMDYERRQVPTRPDLYDFEQEDIGGVR